MLSVPKRLRYFMQRDGAALNTAMRIFLRVVQHSLHAHCPGAAQADKAALRIGATDRAGLERLLRYCVQRANPPDPQPAKRSPARYLWAMLIARIYEVFPLLRPLYAGQICSCWSCRCRPGGPALPPDHRS